MENSSSQTSLTATPSPGNISKEITSAKNRSKIIFVVIIVVLLLTIFGLIAYAVISNNANISKTINSFEECVAAGNPVMESYPRQCRTTDGQLFVEQIESVGNTSNPNGEQKTVKLYFSQDPESFSNPLLTVETSRESNRGDLEVYVIEELIAGPTEDEKTDLRLYSEIKLQGDSNCEGKDFILSINTSKVANLKFCKDVIMEGTLNAPRIKESITDTLLQFSTIEKVMIYDKTGENMFSSKGI